MFGKRTLRIAAVAAAVALPMAVAATSPAAAAPKANTATVSVLHGIPASVLEAAGVAGGIVDVCANGSVELIGDFAPGELKTLTKVTPGAYTLSVHAGALGCGSPAILSAQANVEAGKNYTVTANLAPTSATTVAPALNVFANNIASIGKTKKQNMKNGEGRVTVRHIAAAPEVGIVANGSPVAALSPLSNGQSKETVLKKGTYQVGATVNGVVALGPVPLKVRQGWNVIVYAWGLPTSATNPGGPSVAVQYVKLNVPKK